MKYRVPALVALAALLAVLLFFTSYPRCGGNGRYAFMYPDEHVFTFARLDTCTGEIVLAGPRMDEFAATNHAPVLTRVWVKAGPPEK